MIEDHAAEAPVISLLPMTDLAVVPAQTYWSVVVTARLKSFA